MKAACITAVSQAIGRPITQAESKDIENRIRSAMTSIARQDATRWRTLSNGQRLDEAAKLAAQQIVAEANTKKARLGLTIQQHDFVSNYADAQKQSGWDKTGLDSLGRLLSAKRDGHDNALSVESKIKGTMSVVLGQMAEAIEAIKPRFLGLLANRAAENELHRAMFGESKNPEFIKAAKEWSDTAEAMRQQFNAAGGQVGKLENWAKPQSWSKRMALRYKDQFVDDFFSRVDRNQYLHDDGTPYSDQEMRTFLESAFQTIATEGANKTVDVSIPGGAIKANRNSAERQIHVKDAESSIFLFNKYGSGNLLSTMVNHLRRMARDTALVDTFGPNSDLAVAHFIDQYRRQAVVADPAKSAKIDGQATDLSNLYNYLAGNNRTARNQLAAQIAADARQLLSGIKLGFLPFSQLPDYATLALTAHTSRLPPLQVFSNLVRAMTPFHGEKSDARRAGLMVHTILEELNRFGSDNMGSRWSSKVAGTLIRATGANAMSEATRRAYSITMLDAIGEATRKHALLSDLTEHDVRLLGKGITQQDWDIWRAATPETWRGNDSVLTSEAVLSAPGFSQGEKMRAAISLMGAVNDERDMAVIEPSARLRSSLTNAADAGTLRGELWKSFLMFKTFPAAIYESHWRRGFSQETATGKVAYVASLVSMQMMLGAVALEMTDLVTGKNPRSFVGPQAAQNWMAALLKGGALGPYADFLFSDTTSYGKSLGEQIAGPFIGFIGDTHRLFTKPISEAEQDRPNTTGADIVRYAKSYLLPNTWYTKAVLDHLIFNQLQENLSPGYLARSQARSQSQYGTSWWWRPDQTLPASAPDMQKMVATH